MVDENKTPGLGCPGDCECDPSTEAEVYRLLRLGSPRLALARAMCVPFQPTVVNVRALFSATNVTTIPNVAADEQYSQDNEILAARLYIGNESTTANSDEFRAQSDYFFAKQSGIEAQFQVGKAPFYAVSPRFTPICPLIESINDIILRRGWVLGKTQQITMTFNATVTLPVAPLEVVIVLTGQIPESDKFMDGQMSRREALDKLDAFGIRTKGFRSFECR